MWHTVLNRYRARIRWPFVPLLRCVRACAVQRCKCITRTAGTVSKNNNNGNNERETISSPVIYVLLWFYMRARSYLYHTRVDKKWLEIGIGGLRCMHAKSTIDMCYSVLRTHRRHRMCAWERGMEGERARERARAREDSTHDIEKWNM